MSSVLEGVFFVMVHIWGMLIAATYTIYTFNYTSKSHFGQHTVIPTLEYYQTKIIATGIRAFIDAVVQKPPNKESKDITYHEDHAIITVRDGAKSYEVYLPYNKKLKKLSNSYHYIMHSENPDELKPLHISQPPGVPIMITPGELGYTEMKMERIDGKKKHLFKKDERFVCLMQALLSEHGRKKKPQ